MDFVATTTTGVTYGDWMFVNSIALLVVMLALIGFLMSVWNTD